MSRRVGVLTTGRWDYSILRPVIQKLAERTDLSPELIVTGAHLAPRYGSTVADIERDGFRIAARVPIPLEVDAPLSAALSAAEAGACFARAYAELQLDVLLLVGDRWETHAAACSAVPFRLPLAHLHGGEVTEGALDELYRHAITKLSHLHFVAAPEFGARLARLGEEPWRVTVSGAPGLESLVSGPHLSREALQEATGLDVSPRTLLVTLHPETQVSDDQAGRVRELLAALEEVGAPVILTHPNADRGSETIREAIQGWAEERDWAAVTIGFGSRFYPSALRLAAAVVGNSSSGILEAASFQRPVVNIGDRQRGRLRGANVIDAPSQTGAIAAAIRRALDPEFGAALAELKNPYGGGEASGLIVDRLAEVALDERLLTKRFHDGGPQ